MVNFNCNLIIRYRFVQRNLNTLTRSIKVILAADANEIISTGKLSVALESIMLVEVCYHKF